MTLKSRGPIPLYYESLYGILTLKPFRVHFVLKAGLTCGGVKSPQAPCFVAFVLPTLRQGSGPSGPTSPQEVPNIGVRRGSETAP